MDKLHRLHDPRPLHRGGVRDRGQRPGAHLHDDPGLQHRARRLRHGDGLRLLGLQPAPGPAGLAVAVPGARRGRAGDRLVRRSGSSPAGSARRRSASALVVTVGLFVGLIGLAPADLAARRRAPCRRSSRRRASTSATPAITAHQLITILTSVAGRRRPLPAAQPHPDRHRHAGLGRQPRPAAAVRRQARPGRRAVLGDRHLARRPGRHPARVGRRPRLLTSSRCWSSTRTPRRCSAGSRACR